MPVRLLKVNTLTSRLERNWAEFGFAKSYPTPLVFDDAAVTDILEASMERLCEATVTNCTRNLRISVDEATLLFNCVICSGVGHVLGNGAGPDQLRMELRAVLILAIIIYEEFLRNGGWEQITRNGSHTFLENQARKLLLIHRNGGFRKDCKGELLRRSDIMLKSLYDSAPRKGCFPVSL